MDMIEIARPSGDYCRANGIDFRASIPACGGLFVSGVQSDGRRFEPCPDGTLAAWCECYAEDAETVLDVVAWSLDQPDRFLTLTGAAPALGMAAAANPATYALGFPLRLHRTPLAWLQAGCDGAVILDQAAGGRWLRDLEPPRLAAEDAAHARDLDAMLKAASPMPRIMVPSTRAA